MFQCFSRSTRVSMGLINWYILYWMVIMWKLPIWVIFNIIKWLMFGNTKTFKRNLNNFLFLLSISIFPFLCSRCTFCHDSLWFQCFEWSFMPFWSFYNVMVIYFSAALRCWFVGCKTDKNEFISSILKIVYEILNGLLMVDKEFWYFLNVQIFAFHEW